MNTIFFPSPKYVPHLSKPHALTLRQLCESAGIACRASGDWVNRLVSWETGGEMEIFAEPGPQGAVHVILPSSVRSSLQQISRDLLVVMAYGVFDGVAKESVRGVAWARKVAPSGRPRLPRAKSSAERQRAWRARNTPKKSSPSTQQP